MCLYARHFKMEALGKDTPVQPLHPHHFNPECPPIQQYGHPSQIHPKHQMPPSVPSPKYSSPQAPAVPFQEQSMQTPYMVMCIQADQARRRYTIGAAIFTWLVLAGYLVVPNTFTSLQSSKTLSDTKGGQILQSTVQNVKLLPLAGALCLIGTVGSCWLWSRWRTNYVWLLRNIFV
jgi:hypothetical protein